MFYFIKLTDHDTKQVIYIEASKIAVIKRKDQFTEILSLNHYIFCQVNETPSEIFELIAKASKIIHRDGSRRSVADRIREVTK